MVKGSSIFWIKINNLYLLLFEIFTFSNHTTKSSKGVMIFFFFLKLKKKGRKKLIHRDEVKKKKKKKTKMNTLDEFCRLKEF